MTVTAEQVDKVEAAGFVNVDAMASACNQTKCPFYLAVAMFQKESKGRNVYGGDSGGALRGYKGPVDAGSYRVFRWMVDEGVPVKQPDGTHKIVKFGPNGVGPAQITHPDLVRKLKEQGLTITVPADNILFGVRLLFSYYRYARDTLKLSRHDSIKYAGTRYNGDPDYGVDLLAVALKWKDIVGDDDYT